MTYDMKHCTLCPRRCGADRTPGQSGYCRSASSMHIALAALHMWEEPCISGSGGSGAVFFTGCNLRCRFCQNAKISRSGTLSGTQVSPEELAAHFLRLEDEGACNINLVTAGHYIVPCARAVEIAKKQGLKLPIVYNSSGYELPEALRLLEGLVDVWLPDFKYMDPELARKYSQAPDYPGIAARSLKEMVRQAEERFGEGARFDENGIMTGGVIVRLLLLPGHVKDAKNVVSYLYRTYRNRIWISLMSQYTPVKEVKEDPLLGRRVTKREYDRLVDYAISLGVTQAYVQDRSVASESFIPAFGTVS